MKNISYLLAARSSKIFFFSRFFNFNKCIIQREKFLLVISRQTKKKGGKISVSKIHTSRAALAVERGIIKRRTPRHVLHTRSCATNVNGSRAFERKVSFVSQWVNWRCRVWAFFYQRKTCLFFFCYLPYERI